MVQTLLLLALAALHTIAAARCDGPYKTLSSDCRGLAADANTVCVVYDRRDGQSTPCTTPEAAIHQTECAPAVRANQPCDVLRYRIGYQTTKARFRITFPSPTNGTRRQLQVVENTTTSPPPPTTAPAPTSVDANPTRTPPPTTSLRVDTTTPPPTTAPAPTTALPDVLVDHDPPRPTTPPTDPNGNLTPPPTTPSAPPADLHVDATTPPPTTTTPAPPFGLRVDATTPPPTTTVPAPTVGLRVDVTTPPPTTVAPPQPTLVDSTTAPPTTSSAPSPSVGPTPSTTPPILGTRVDAPVTRSPTNGPSTTPTNATNNFDIAAESNNFVNAIGQLKLDPSVTELRIVGGSSEFGTRGKAVQLSIDPQFLVPSPHITTLWIANCNISSQLYTGGLVSGLPQVLTDLNLRNTMMQSEPIDVSALQNLRTLQMGQNYLTTLTRNISLSKLTMLDASENSLKSFEPALPVLESLYLNKNSFIEIPKSIYSMSKLQELQMTENSIVAIVVSSTQYGFLAKLRLNLDKLPTTPPTPVIYVSKNDVSKNAGPSVRALAAEVAGLNLSDPNTDLKNAVAKPVGNLTDLQGVSVWTLSDEEYAIFEAQQDAISNSDVVINGTKVQSYLALAAAGAAAVTKNLSPSTSSPDGHKTDSPSNGNNGSTSDSGKTVAIVIGCVAAALFVVTATLIVIRKRQSTKKDRSTVTTVTTPSEEITMTAFQADNSKSNDENSMESLGALGATMKDAAVRDLFISRRIRLADLEDVHPIGSNGSGVIWLVKHRGTRFLASKRLIQNSATTQRMNDFVNEIVIAADLEYPTIIRLTGVAWTDETDLQALYEYMPNGDLQTYLYNIPPASLPWQGAKIQMAIDIIEALVYTHSFSPPLLHRDLRTRSVLLDELMKPKLSNFGSARFASEQNTMTTDGIGSGRWLAPEILRRSTDYNSASDIYAYGVLLCELDTHKAPYDDVRDFEGNPVTETTLIDLVARGRVQPTLSPTCPPQIRDIVTMCLSQNPQERPPAMRVAYELRLLVREWS